MKVITLADTPPAFVILKHTTLLSLAEQTVKAGNLLALFKRDDKWFAIFRFDVGEMICTDVDSVVCGEKDMLIDMEKKLNENREK